MHVTPPKPEQATVDHTASPEESVADTPAGTITLDFLAPAQNTDELGRLGHYRILKILGKGGMGMVFLAEDSKLDRHVALKVMLPKFAEDAAAKQRFLREAKTAAKIEHDHIVHIYQVDEDRGVPFLAMQLLSGSSLEDVLRRAGRLKVPQILRLGAQIAEGLAVAHGKGLIHRDIKPANIWVEANYGGRVKLLDFGLARTVETDIGITQSGAILGTPAYMPPEQARGEHVDHRCDLYALGCVIYRMATGELPIKGKDTMALLMALALNEPTPPKQINDAIPTALNDLILKLLAKDADNRPETAKSVATTLRNIERELAKASLPSDVTGELAALATPAAPAPPTTIPEPSNPFANLNGSSVAASDQPGAAAEATKPDSAGTQLSPGQSTQVRPTKPRRMYAIAGIAAGLLAVIAAGIVIFVQTNYGTVRIEIHDSEIEVAVKGEDIILKYDDKDKDIMLRPGPALLKITRGAFTFETDKLILKRGDKVTVEIRLLGGKVQLLHKEDVLAEAKLTDYALEFDGKSSYVSIPTLALPEPRPFTMEAYAVPRREATEGHWVLGQRTGLTDILQGKQFNAWHARYYNHHAQSDAPPEVGRRVHLACVWNGSECRLYVDGKRQAYTLRAASFTPGEQGISIGARTIQNGDVTHFFDGLIDEVRISKIARYDEDFVPEKRFETDADTLGLYHFDEGQGDKLIDSSGNNHHGKIVGAKWVKMDVPAAPSPRSDSRPMLLHFDGKKSWVDLPALKYDVNKPLTVEAYVTWQPTGRQQEILHQGGGNGLGIETDGHFGFAVALENNKDGPAKWYGARSKVSLSPGQEAHIAAVFDGKKITLFLDGREAAATAHIVGEDTAWTLFPGVPRWPKGPTRLGAHPVRGEHNFFGSIRGARVSSVVRYAKNFTPAKRLEREADTIVLYHFDEGQGDKLIDSSGNGHHGKIVGAKWVKVDR